MQKEQQDVRKEEVEELLGCSIEDSLFLKALQYAKKAQAYIYECEGRTVVLQHWYLVKLTEEYARSLAFSEFTKELCRNIRSIEENT